MQILFKAEGHIGLHDTTVTDVESCHVLRKPSLKVTIPGLATMQRAKDILVNIQNIALLYKFILLHCLLPTGEHHPVHKMDTTNALNWPIFSHLMPNLGSLLMVGSWHLPLQKSW